MNRIGERTFLIIGEPQPNASQAAFGLPMVEGHGGLRAASVASVPPWWISIFECKVV